MELLEDAVFGSGKSVPGAEDSSVLYDSNGFPYMRGTTMKGLLREVFENYIAWTDGDSSIISGLFGEGGTDIESDRKLYISDVVLPAQVKKAFEGLSADEILEACTYTRTFTEVEDGKASDGSLRTVRCIKKGLVFYGEISFSEEDEELIKSVVPMLKWVGSMRTRGMGKVRTEVCG
ncbi:MAG: hypothetical protein E7505_09920 [Ruminococcus sp.]|nr:hypothetical protein [Ruminococcus sp.]